MSLGWLSESALMPKKSKDISVEGSTMLDLQAALFQRQIDVKAGIPSTQRGSSKSLGDVLGGKNTGVEQRNRADNVQEKAVENISAEMLKKKAKIYDQIMAGRVSGSSERFLVDFEQKSWTEQDAAVSDSNKFWEGLARPSAELVDPAFQTVAHERELWEAKALEELKQEKASITKALGGKLLSQEEKDALKQMSADTLNARERAEQVKLKRKCALDERRRLVQEKEQRKQGRKQQLPTQLLATLPTESASSVPVLTFTTPPPPLTLSGARSLPLSSSNILSSVAPVASSSALPKVPSFWQPTSSLWSEGT